MSKTALLVLDFINDIVHPDGKIAAAASYVKESGTIKNANRAIEIAQTKNFLKIFVKVGFSSSYLECPANSPLFGKMKEIRALELNTWGTEFHSELLATPQDLVIIKHRVSPFYATDLEAILRANKVDTLLLCGVSTPMVVSATARDAHDRDYRVIVIEDACGAPSSQIHQSAIETLLRISEVIKTNDLSDFLIALSS